MTNTIKPPRTLLSVTFVILLALASTVFYFSRSELPPAISLNVEGQPTIGYPKARVHIVVFEEPKCSNCREYNNEVFPVIKKEFIDTNKVQYTVVPVAFLPGSMPAAVAALCIYNQDPAYPNSELYFKFIEHIYAHQPDENTDWATSAKLMEFAKQTSPAIKLDSLKKCIDTEAYRVQIMKNTDYGKEIMGGVISTPTIYVNGIMVHEISADKMRSLIKKILEHEGVY